jgi:D-glycero-alpha-D-manno-heptose-7-phosphate kinase
LEIHHDGDLPARSGLGSSSAFTVGLLHALHALKGNMPSKYQLVKESIHIEQKVLKEVVGSQDQVLTAHGGFNHITFHKNGEIKLRPITIASKRIKELEDHLMLFYTGIPRTASEVASSYIENIDTKKQQLHLMHESVEKALSILTGKNDIRSFGELLNDFWQIKKSLSTKVSTSAIDAMYKKSLSAGAIGGKLIGAGGGGFLLLFVPPKNHKKVKENLRKLIHVPFKFEPHGSQIIFYDQQESYSYLSRRKNS